MHWKRPALAVGIAVIAVACTTVEAAPPDTPIEDAVAVTTTIAEEPAGQATQSVDPQRDLSDTTTTVGAGQQTTTTTAARFEPAATTTTTAATVETTNDGTTTTTEASTVAVPPTGEIEDLLDTLDDLLSDIEGQLDGLDDAVDEAADSLNQDEGDIGQ